MPTRFTPAQLAASAAVGELRDEASFAGDTSAWRAYQEQMFTTLTLGEVLPPVGDPNRAKRWKAARRQRGKIEEQRGKENTEDAEEQMQKRLKVSDKWQAKHATSLQNLTASVLQPSPGGTHATRQLHATVVTPGGAKQYSEEVHYSLPPVAGERESAAKRREDRHRRREQLAIERLSGANEKEAAAERAEAEAKMKEEQAEEERLLRKGGIVRDGNTIYEHETFKRIDPTAFKTAMGGRSSEWTSFDRRDLRVYYPDGSSCNVRPPRARERRTPWRLVQPWTQRHAVLPPIVCSFATLEELRDITTALISLGSDVFCGAAEGWRQRHLTMAVCRCDSCVYGNDCVTYAPPGQPRSHSELARLDITHTNEAAWQPLHVPLAHETCWGRRPYGGPPDHISKAVAAALLLTETPPQRTVFTPVAARHGLPPRLQYMQSGDVVLWNGVPHFVLQIGAQTFGEEPEILFRTAVMHGRNRGIAQHVRYGNEPLYLSRVAEELELPRDEDIEWAQSTAAAVKAGVAIEMLPPPPPPPPIWRRTSLRKRSASAWTSEAEELGLPPSLHMLEAADVVMWKGQPHFVDSVKSESGHWYVKLSEPERFAMNQVTPHPTSSVVVTVPPRAFPQREERRQMLCEHLTLADAATAEAARVAADDASLSAAQKLAEEQAALARFVQECVEKERRRAAAARVAADAVSSSAAAEVEATAARSTADGDTAAAVGDGAATVEEEGDHECRECTDDSTSDDEIDLLGGMYF